MNIVIIDSLYREQRPKAAKWFIKLIKDSSRNSVYILELEELFSNQELIFKGTKFIFSDLQDKSKFKIQDFQEIRSRYHTKGFNLLNQKLKFFLSQRKVSKIWFFGENQVFRKIFNEQRIPTNFLELAPQRSPDKFFVSKTGINSSLSSFSYDTLLEKCSSFSYTHKARQNKKLKILIPMQLKYDRSFFPHSDFMGLNDFIEKLFFFQNKILEFSTLTVKRHPGMRKDLIAKDDFLAAKKNFSGRIGFYSLFDSINSFDLVLTKCSSFGIFANINNKPYIHFVDSILGEGVSYDQFPKVLEAILTYPEALEYQKECSEILESKSFTKEELLKQIMHH